MVIKCHRSTFMLLLVLAFHLNSICDIYSTWTFLRWNDRIFFVLDNSDLQIYFMLDISL